MCVYCIGHWRFNLVGECLGLLLLKTRNPILDLKLGLENGFGFESDPLLLLLLKISSPYFSIRSFWLKIGGVFIGALMTGLETWMGLESELLLKMSSPYLSIRSLGLKSGFLDTRVGVPSGVPSPEEPVSDDSDPRTSLGFGLLVLESSSSLNMW